MKRQALHRRPRRTAAAFVRLGPACLALALVLVLLFAAPANPESRASADCGSGTDRPFSAPGECLSEEEADLARMINELRRSNGLAPLPVSRSLTQVAQWHVIDLEENSPRKGPDGQGSLSSLHSWSSKGMWKPVSYKGDRLSVQGMRNKPREITSNLFTGSGYEIAYRHSAGATPSRALAGWMRSPGHNAVVLEKGSWARAGWTSMGVGMYGEHAVAWFGNRPDPQGMVTRCQARTLARLE